MSIKRVINCSIIALLITAFAIFSFISVYNIYHAKVLQAEGFLLNKSNPGNKNSINLLQRSLAVNDGDWRTKWFLAQLHYNHENYKEAELLLLELLEQIELAEIRLFLYNTYLKMKDYDQLLSQSIEIFSRYSFYGSEYINLSPQLNNLIEFKIIKIIINPLINDKDGRLREFLESIFSLPYKNLPYEHFRGILHILDRDCDSALEYFYNYHRIYINKQLLSFYACCFEPDPDTGQRNKLISREINKMDKDIISRFMVNFYERYKE